MIVIDFYNSNVENIFSNDRLFSINDFQVNQKSYPLQLKMEVFLKLI